MPPSRRSVRPPAVCARLVTAAFLLLATPAVASAASAPVTRSVTSGPVTATATATGDVAAPGVHLTIDRGGVRLFDGVPGVPSPDPSEFECGGPDRNTCTLSGWDASSGVLQVRDVNGDGEPEVVIDQYTGGAHCCSFATVLYLLPDATGYGQWSRNFADFGFKLVSRKGRVLFRTVDARFTGLYGSYAESAEPIELLRWSGTDHWRLVTPSYRSDVRKDLAAQRTRLRQALRRRGSDPRGAAAAWAADSYRLGQRTTALRYLRRLANAGRFRAGLGGPGGRAFVHSLDGRLRRWDYRP